MDRQDYESTGQRRLLSRMLQIRNLLQFLPHLSIALLVAIYLLIQHQHFTPAYQEVDPDGYLFLAKRMARFQSLAVQDDDPFIYQTHQWVETPEGHVTAKFSPGYPLLMAFFYRLGGDEAMFLVSPAMGALTLVGAYLLFGLWMSPLAAAAATWVLGLNPMFLIYTGYLLTHGTNICFATWGMFFLWRWIRRERRRDAICAGLLLGYAVTVRHTSALLACVVAIAVMGYWIATFDWARLPLPRIVSRFTNSLTRDDRPGEFREGLVLLAAYSLFPVCMAIYNWVLFDSPLVTGYGLTHEQDAFAWSFLQKNLRTMLGGLNTTALYLILPVGLAGMLLVDSLRERLMRILWFLPVVVLYTAYYWAPAGMPYLRFTIATFPAVIGAAFLLMDLAARSVPQRPEPNRAWLRHLNQGILVLLTFLLVFLRYGEAQRGMKGVVSDPGSRAAAAAGRMLAETLEPDAVIFSQPPFFCYVGTREDFRLYDLRVFGGFSGSGERRQPIRTERLKAFYEGLGEAGRLQKKRELIRSFLKQNRQVAFLIPPDALAREQGQLGADFGFTLLKEWRPQADGAIWTLYTVLLEDIDD